MIYSIDTSSLSNGWVKLYPPDVFPIWEKLDEVVSAGIVVATEEVLEELERGDEDLFAWVKARKQMFIPHDEVIQGVVTEICAKHPNLVDEKRQRSQCDPWVIALAQINGLRVVTEENSKPKHAHIPDVCAIEGIPCINLLGMIRELGWKFRV